MIWGQQSVPALAVWGTVLMAAALVLVATLRLRGRPRRLGIAALMLVAAIPLTARAITLPHTFSNGTVADANQVNANFAALARGRKFGLVNANATLDAEVNGGIVAVSQPFTGQYCFNLGGRAKNAVANIDPTTTGSVLVIMTYVPHAGALGLSGCPSGFNDAAVLVKSTTGALVSAGFYIAFE